MPDKTVRGRFVWHELITPNSAGAHEFYSRTLGWQKQAWEHDASYELLIAPRGAIGATVEAAQAPPHWLAYIGTTDVDATVAAAEKLGAKVATPPTTVPNGGRHAVLVDPQGASFGVHASPSESPPERPAGYGEFSWHELATTVDPSIAFDFYTELFGWDEMLQMDMGASGTYLIFGRNGTQLGGMFNKGETGRPGTGYWVGYVRVRDLDDALTKAKAGRGALLNGPMDVPGGDRIAQLMDPHGAFFAVHMIASDTQPAETADKAPPRKRAATSTRKAARKTGKKEAAPKKKAKTARKATKKQAKKSSKKAPRARASKAKSAAAGKKRSAGKKRAAAKSSAAKPKKAGARKTKKKKSKARR